MSAPRLFHQTDVTLKMTLISASDKRVRRTEWNMKDRTQELRHVSVLVYSVILNFILMLWWTYWRVFILITDQKCLVMFNVCPVIVVIMRMSIYLFYYKYFHTSFFMALSWMWTEERGNVDSWVCQQVRRAEVCSLRLKCMLMLK